MVGCLTEGGGLQENKELILILSVIECWRFDVTCHGHGSSWVGGVSDNSWVTSRFIIEAIGFNNASRSPIRIVLAIMYSPVLVMGVSEVIVYLAERSGLSFRVSGISRDRFMLVLMLGTQGSNRPTRVSPEVCFDLGQDI